MKMPVVGPPGPQLSTAQAVTRSGRPWILPSVMPLRFGRRLRLRGGLDGLDRLVVLRILIFMQRVELLVAEDQDAQADAHAQDQEQGQDAADVGQGLDAVIFLY